MHPVLGLCPLEWYHDGQGLIDHCCVLRQAAQHKATSGGADSSVCRICVDFHLSTLSLESDMPDTNCWEKKTPKNTAAAGTWGTEDDEKNYLCTDTVSCQSVRGDKGQMKSVAHRKHDSIKLLFHFRLLPDMLSST